MEQTENARCDTGALTAWRRVEANNTSKFRTFQQAARKPRETAGDYPNIVARLSDKWRVILCGAGIQWILPRYDGERAGRARWAGVGYCRTREALLRLCRTSSTRIDPIAWAALTALPEHFNNDDIKPAPITATGPKFVGLMARG